MYDNWAEVSNQLNQVLECERTLRQARRRQQPSVWQSLWQWASSALRLAQGERRSPAGTGLSTTPSTERQSA